MILRNEIKCELARRDFWEYCKLLAPDFYKEDRKFLKDKCREYQDFYESTDEYLIDRAKHDSRDFEVLQAALGQKPIDKVQATQTVVDMSAFSTEEIKAMLDDDIP